MLPIVDATFRPVVAAICLIPPMAMLPILFIVFGLGDLSKVVLIVFGVAPFLTRDMAFAVERLPREQLIKAQTLGASTWQVAIRVVLPQIMPRLIEGVRLSLGPAFLFLISAEAIAADTGLGYRIFLVRRYPRDGRDPALRRVDHADCLPHGLRALEAVAERLRLGARRGAAMSAIAIRDVWVEYGDQVVLERINLDIAEGAFLSVVGPSGAGKSTFLRLILGQERPTRGTIKLDGKPLPGEPGPDRVVFQRYSGVPASDGAAQRAHRIRVRAQSPPRAPSRSRP